MRGLIYKELALFYKSLSKKIIIYSGIAIVLLMVKGGAYAGLLASIMVSWAIGMQNLLCFSSDEKASWEKYQLVMPVKGFHVVASKYVSVILTLVISVLGSIIFNIIFAIIYGSFIGSVFAISIAAAILIPVLWTAICFPLTYWFGFKSSQIMGVFIVFPLVKLVSYFEDGPGVSVVINSKYIYLLWALILTAVIFAASLMISVAGYLRKNKR